MNGPDDISRERDDRPNDPTPSPPEAENGHAIPFGEGVYGLGRNRPGEPPKQPDPPRRKDPFAYDDEPTAQSEPSEPPSDFDFSRLAADLGFESHTEGHRCVGWCPICRTSDVLRSVTTPELRAAWFDFQHELARALRSAAERYAASDETAEPSERITEIPID